jgi:hypothetical protein
MALFTISLPPPFPSSDTVHVSIVLTQELKILPLQQKYFLVYPSLLPKKFSPSKISLPSLSPFPSLRTQPKEQTKNWNSLSLYGTTPGDAQTRFFFDLPVRWRKSTTNLCFGSHTELAVAKFSFFPQRISALDLTQNLQLLNFHF